MNAAASVNATSSLCPGQDENASWISVSVCWADYLSCIPHLAFAILSSLLLLLYGCCPGLRRAKTPYTLHYPFHHLRWLLLFAVLVALTFFVQEGVLSHLKSQPGTGTHPHLYLPAGCAWLAAALACVLYHHSEAWLQPGFAWLLLAYWGSALAGESIRLASWMEDPDNIDIRIVRFDAIVFMVSSSAVLFLVELCAIVVTCLRPSKHKSLPADLLKPDMKYYMRYVSFPSRMLFTWQGWLLRVGYQHPLENSDLGSLPEMSTSRSNERNFEWYLQKEKERAAKLGGPEHFSLYRVLFRAYLGWHVAAFLLKFTADSLHFVVPLTVGGIVSYATVLFYDEGEASDGLSEFVTVSEFFQNGFVLLFLMGVVGLLRLLLLHSNYHALIVSSVHLRVGVQAAVYNKSLRLSSWTVTSGAMTTGQITNLMSVDSLNLMMFYQYGQYAYSLPIMITVLMAMMVHLLGVAALIASLCFIVAIPIQYKLAQIQARVQKHALKISDERLKQTHEMLQGMKLIKLYGWENIFCSAIASVRRREIRKLMKAVIFYCIAILTSYFVPAFVTLLSFLLFMSFTGSSLTPAIAFTTLTIVNQLRFPVRMFAMMIRYIINNHVSVQRLNKFFTAREIEREEGGGDFFLEEDGDSTFDPEKETEILNHNDLPEVEIQVGTHGKAKFHRIPSLEGEAANSRTDPVGVIPRDGTDYVALTSEPEETTDAVRPALPDDVAIKIKNGSFSWDPDSRASMLSDIDVEFPAGSLTMIVGQVGMGKSSLLSAILGEMHTTSGYVQFNRKRRGIAYSAQRAWLLNASLRDNILFGQEFEEDKYQAVVSACSLQPDIDILPARDQTEIGEKGINLSGGQKQRVSVARAMYSHNDLVILDDPLSALDVHVGSQLFQDGIVDLLLGGKRTVVLVTHQLQYMKYAHKVLVMKDGRVSLQGTPNEVWVADPDLQITSRHLAEAASRSEAETGDEEAEKERQMLLKLVEEKKKEEERGNVSEEEGRLIEKEERNTGTISWTVIVFYLRAMKYPLACSVMALTLLQHGLMVATDFWLSRWSEAGKRMALDNVTEEESQSLQQFYVYSYTSMILAASLVSFIATLMLFLSGMVAAKHLHTGMLRVISKAPMRFFDTTPVGRILNRFSGDTNVVDAALINNVWFFLESTFRCLTAIIVNSIVSPIFIVIMLPVFICYFILQRYFITTSRELQRLDSISKSPIYAHFSESLSGLPTIRAYRDEKRFKNYLLDAIDQNTIAVLYANTCNRWLGVRLDAVGNLCVFLAGLTSLTVSVTSELEPSYVGLALAYALAAANYLNWFIRHTSLIETQMNAIERMKYYSEIPTENYKGKLPKPEWPDWGAVSVNNISVRYAEKLEPVLQNISLDIQPGQKIGICGRTGSGKSSLTLALFRIVDTFKGKILIDSVDIASLPLDHLRLKLSIIPQDPILFSGSIRFNLDPHGKCSEEELWTALDIAQLKTVVTELDAGLDSQVAEGGDNFSMGQRQLFCLARAFLRKSRILILDEATASIDMETDDIVQKVLAEEFSDRTVLVIAHRVTTILDADRILVLSEGGIAEFDTPQNLFAKEDSQFAALVQSAHH
ncbi:ATP-binding cassette sub-family C member 9-like isoform X2 [Acanthaster planci]|nr:ATP-binding cassette sub-family C member 9-like isoform X2 [Acanthaster planci]